MQKVAAEQNCPSQYQTVGPQPSTDFVYNFFQTYTLSNGRDKETNHCFMATGPSSTSPCQRQKMGHTLLPKWTQKYFSPNGCKVAEILICLLSKNDRVTES